MQKIKLAVKINVGRESSIIFPGAANKIFVILLLSCSNCWTLIRAESPFYRQRVEHDVTFVDKSLLIEDYFRSCNDICRVLRPKGWGKTTNLDMLKRFLEIETDPNNGKRLTFEERVNDKLFAGGQIELENGQSKQLAALKIAAHSDIVKLQGQQPTIYISFESITGVNYEEVENKMKYLIETIFNEHAYLKKVSNESTIDRFERYQRADHIENEEMLADSLRFLSDLLRKHFKSSVHLLADDYDVPIRSVFLAVYHEYESKFGFNLTDKEICAKVDNSVRLQKVISLVENILGRCLQNTETIKYGMITAVLDIHLRAVSERSVYDVRCSLVDRMLFDHYGFSEHELGELLTKTGLSNCDERRQEVQRWYRYTFSGKPTYSPWSIARYLLSHGKANNYFISRPENYSLSNLVFMTDDLQPKFRNLMVNRTFSCDHSTRIFFDRFIDEYKVLLFEGYLNADSREYLVEDISIPNSEIRQIFENKAVLWLNRRLGIPNDYFASVADCLIELDIEEFRKKFIMIVSNIPPLEQNNSEMEKVYYDGIVAGLFRNLTISGNYTVAWNEQKGFFGKISVAAVPKEPNKIDPARNNAVFLDYNTADNADDAKLQLDAAWKLINQKLRSVNLSLESYNKANKFLKLVLIFYGNKFDIRHEIIN